jgi:predicted phage terminase large subunit-like protein
MSMTTFTASRVLKRLKTPRQKKEALALALYERMLRLERKRQDRRGGLIHFVRYFWHIVEPNREFVDGWTLWAMCRHLEAVSRGEITKLLINVPPGSMKSLLVNVFWPAWEWSAFGRPDLRYVSFSYSSQLTERDNQRLIDIIKSQRFQDMYPKFKMTSDGKIKPSNSAKGWKFATSFSGVGTGERGDRVLVDDPHNIADGESDVIRTEIVRKFREAISNRLNDIDKSAIIVIMQRVHEDDVSGSIIDNELGYVHLCITAEYEEGRHCETEIGWSDPRSREGELFWPERFSEASLKALKREIGEYAWNGQYQQRPEIRGGGLIKRDWWQEWSPDDGQWPVCDHIIASLDPAFTSKESNDPSGFAIWGAFRQENGDAGLILLYAFRAHLELHGGRSEKWVGETDDDFRARCKPTWGLVETVHDACKRFHVKHLLIEAKGPGHSVAQEMRRLHAGSGYSVELVDPKGLDKTARVIRVQPMFTEGQIYVPISRKTGTIIAWAQKVIDEFAIFPKGKHDDLVDACTQALYWLRNHGFAIRHSEQFMSKRDSERYAKPEGPLYPT